MSGALVVGGFTPAAQAVESVSIDQDELASQLFAGVAEVRFSELDRVKAVTMSAEFLEWRRLHPAASQAESQAQLTSRKLVLDSGLTATDKQLPEPALVLRAIDVLTAGTGGGAARTSSYIKALGAGIIGTSLAPLDNREDLSSGALRNASWQRARSDALSDVWAGVRQTAMADAAFAQAWNAVLGTPASVNATASLDQLKATPGLLDDIELDKLLGLAGTPDLFLAEANRQSAALNSTLTTLAAQATTDAATQAANCPATAGAKPKCTPTAKEEAEARDKALQKQLDGAKAGLGILTKVIGFEDEGLANQTKVVGEAIITTVSSISKYAAEIAGRGLGDAIFSAATLVATNNVFGAVLSIVGLFGPSQPSLDKQILDQVKALRDEVKALSEAMKANFERVEAELNVIYANMIAEFDKLNEAIAGNAAQLALLQQEVAQLGLRLEKIAADILTAIGDVELLPARTSINQYIGYLENFGQPIPTFTEYLTPENAFNLVSTDLANDIAFVVPAADADNPALDPTTVLNSNGETKSINYLARLASKRDAAIVAPSVPVGNAAVWNLGANAYSLLQLQNPGYAAQVNSSRSTQIATEGQRIANLAASFAHPVTDTTNGFENDLFKSLSADYRTGLTNLSSALKDVRINDVQVRYEPDAQGAQVKALKNYPLFWDGLSSSLGDSPVPSDPASIAGCTATANTITRPTNVSFVSLPREVKTLNYAYTPRVGSIPPPMQKELPEVSMCFTADWVNTRTTDGSNGIVDSFGKLKLTVQTRFRLNPGATWGNARTTSYTWPTEELYERTCLLFNCGFSVDPYNRLAQLWADSTQRSAFQTGATSTINASLVASSVSTFKGFLTLEQQLLYQRDDAAISTVGTPANTAVKQMNTAARLTQAYTRLGLPIALETDDILSGLLFGQFSLPVNMPTDAKITNVYQTSIGSYAACGTSCTFDNNRPLEGQQNFLEPPCTTSSTVATPGDPLGDCLIRTADQRLTDLTSRFEHHFQRLANGAYAEQLPWFTGTATALKVSDRLVHAPAAEPPPAPDFFITLDQESASLTRGGQATVHVTLTALNGFNGTPKLTIAGLPTGINASFSPDTLSVANPTATLTLTAMDTTLSDGTYPVTISTDSTLTGVGKTATLQLTISGGNPPPPAPDFSIALDQQSANLTTLGEVTIHVTLTALNGFNGTLKLSVAGLPSGINASFSPDTISVGSPTSTLTLTAKDTSISNGNTYTVTIATDSTLTGPGKTAILQLTINGEGPPPPPSS